MKIYLHLVSDSTGASVHEVARGCIAQFPHLEFVKKEWPMVRHEQDLKTIITTLRHEPGVVLVSIVDREQQQILKEACETQDIPCVSIIQDSIRAIEHYSGQASSRKAGGKYKMDKEYFSRMEAMDFTIAHDDGRSLETVLHADIIILGVSRTSKTPTSIYLAHQGYKVANIPVLRDSFLPPGITLPSATLSSATPAAATPAAATPASATPASATPASATPASATPASATPADATLSDNGSPSPFVVGLVIDPEHLLNVREYRSVNLQRGRLNKEYTDYQTIVEEVRMAMTSYQRYGYSFVNVTFRSIEETAAEILKLFREEKQGKE